MWCHVPEVGLRHKQGTRWIGSGMHWNLAHHMNSLRYIGVQGIGLFYGLLLTLLPLQFLIPLHCEQQFEVMERWLNRLFLGTKIYLAHDDFRFHPFALPLESFLENVLVPSSS